MFMQEDQMPEEIMEDHELHSKVHYNRICMRIDKGTRGTQVAGAL